MSSCNDEGVSLLNLLRGNSQSVGLTITNNGSPYNLSGYNIGFTAKETNYYGPTLFTVSGQILDAAAGTAQLSFVPSNTANLGSDPYYFDIQLTSGASNVTTLAYGVLNIYPK